MHPSSKRAFTECTKYFFKQKSNTLNLLHTHFISDSQASPPTVFIDSIKKSEITRFNVSNFDLIMEHIFSAYCEQTLVTTSQYGDGVCLSPSLMFNYSY